MRRRPRMEAREAERLREPRQEREAEAGRGDQMLDMPAMKELLGQVLVGPRNGDVSVGEYAFDGVEPPLRQLDVPRWVFFTVR